MSDDNTDLRDEMRQEFAEEFGEADFPVSSPMDLLPALSNGPTTKFTAGDISLTAMELSSMGSAYMDFPYDNLDDLLDDAMNGLEEEGYFDSD